MSAPDRGQSILPSSDSPYGTYLSSNLLVAEKPYHAMEIRTPTRVSLASYSGVFVGRLLGLRVGPLPLLPPLPPLPPPDDATGVTLKVYFLDL